MSESNRKVRINPKVRIKLRSPNQSKCPNQTAKSESIVKSESGSAVEKHGRHSCPIHPNCPNQTHGLAASLSESTCHTNHAPVALIAPKSELPRSRKEVRIALKSESNRCPNQYLSDSPNYIWSPIVRIKLVRISPNHYQAPSVVFKLLSPMAEIR